MAIYITMLLLSFPLPITEGSLQIGSWKLQKQPAIRTFRVRLYERRSWQQSGERAAQDGKGCPFLLRSQKLTKKYSLSAKVVCYIQLYDLVLVSSVNLFYCPKEGFCFSLNLFVFQYVNPSWSGFCLI